MTEGTGGKASSALSDTATVQSLNGALDPCDRSDSSAPHKAPSGFKHFLASRLKPFAPVDQDPRTLRKLQKVLILACTAASSSLPGFCSTIYFPALPIIIQDLQASSIAVTMTTSLFVLFMGIAPVFWASFSDHFYIRRPIYLATLLVFAGASIGSAFVNNVWVLVVLRCLQSCGASAGSALGPGTVADCFEVWERGTAMGMMFVGSFFGPLLGPIIGGFLTSGLGWRSTFWFCFALGAVLWLLMFFVMPETYRREEVWGPTAKGAILNGKSKEMDVEANRPASDEKTETTAGLDEKAEEQKEAEDRAEYQAPDGPTEELPDHATTANPNKRGRLNPLASLYLLRHPFVLLSSLESGIAFGTMFTIETVIPGQYQSVYGLPTDIIGLTFLGAGVGNILGASMGGKLSDFFLRRAKDKRGGGYLPEDRIVPTVWPGGFFFIPFGALLFGWAVERHLNLAAPIVGFGILCFGLMQIFGCVSTYLVDAMPGKGASATAAANFTRMVMACALSLVANPLVAAVGPGYLGVLLAALNVVCMLAVVLLKFKGVALRAYSGY
ncbi:hypothetical protein BZG36_02217 [Bifiguratus adelaidae]|uniref:Major facilitator superfamily (MFS) profile domain-containing protein n=1 Tax=Bifiguratus adelaidae TaxID=1938954 RepID=A0A261Y3I2_9FUNG|nr:hypothetical protein BZG36_02217 [Bifiguratus adelaidae]